MTESDLRRYLLAAVPDEPRWIDSRGMVVVDRFRLAWSDEARKRAERGRLPESFVLISRDFPFVGVVGEPSISALERALDGFETRCDLLVQEESLEAIERFGPGLERTEAVVHRLGDERSLPLPDPAWAFDGVRGLRRLRPEDASLLADLPDRVRIEQQAVLPYAPIAAWFEAGRPVSFSSPALFTETLWDISVETLEAWRGQGLAGRCTRWMAELQTRLGREPIWSAHADNAASLRVARKLGFEPVQRFWSVAWHPPQSSA